MSDKQLPIKEKKIVNGMAEDCIRAEMIRKELETMREWDQKWGFLKAKSQDNDGSKKTNILNEPSSGIPVPSVSKQLVDPVKMKNIQDVESPDKWEISEVDKISKEDLKAFYLFSHQYGKLREISGEIYDRYYFPPTSNSQIGWWTVDASKRLQNVGKKDAICVNTLMDGYMNKRRVNK